MTIRTLKMIYFNIEQENVTGTHWRPNAPKRIALRLSDLSPNDATHRYEVTVSLARRNRTQPHIESRSCSGNEEAERLFAKWSTELESKNYRLNYPPESKRPIFKFHAHNI
jgi:hypothetical protein